MQHAHPITILDFDETIATKSAKELAEALLTKTSAYINNQHANPIEMAYASVTEDSTLQQQYALLARAIGQNPAYIASHTHAMNSQSGAFSPIQLVGPAMLVDDFDSMWILRTADPNIRITPALTSKYEPSQIQEGFVSYKTGEGNNIRMNYTGLPMPIWQWSQQTQQTDILEYLSEIIYWQHHDNLWHDMVNGGGMSGMRDIAKLANQQHGESLIDAVFYPPSYGFGTEDDMLYLAPEIIDISSYEFFGMALNDQVMRLYLAQHPELITHMADRTRAFLHTIQDAPEEVKDTAVAQAVRFFSRIPSLFLQPDIQQQFFAEPFQSAALSAINTSMAGKSLLAISGVECEAQFEPISLSASGITALSDVKLSDDTPPRLKMWDNKQGIGDYTPSGIGITKTPKTPYTYIPTQPDPLGGMSTFDVFGIMLRIKDLDRAAKQQTTDAETASQPQSTPDQIVSSTATETTTPRSKYC